MCRLELGPCFLWDRKQSGLVWEKAVLLLSWCTFSVVATAAPGAADSEWAHCGPRWEVSIVPGGELVPTLPNTPIVL